MGRGGRRDFFLMYPCRRNRANYLSDLDKCIPQSALAKEGRCFCWRTIPYETEDFTGVMLKAGPETGALEIAYPLQTVGWHDVYIGMFNTAWRPYQDQRLWIKLGRDRAFSLLYLPRPDIDGGTVIQEIYWKTANLSDQSIVFKQVCTELNYIESGNPNNCDEVWIAYIKLVPLSREEVDLIRIDRERRDTKRLMATQDWGTGMVVDAAAGTVRDLLEPYRDTDFKRIYWEAAVGDLCSYFTKLGRMWTPENVKLTDFPSLGYRRMVRNWIEYVKNGIDPFRVAVDYSHEIGLEFHASYRFSEGMGPFHFSPPFDEVNEGGFFEKHPELRAVRRNGGTAPRVSLAFPETRQFLLSLFLEIATQYPVDGICILFNRRPPFVEFEPPLIEGFKAEFKRDPRQPDIRDGDWLAYRCRVLTDFMRDLRAKLDSVASVRESKRILITVWVFGNEEENLYYGLDAKTWIKERLIDVVVPYTSAKELFSWELAWENQKDVKYWLTLTENSACELVLNIMPRGLSLEDYCRKAHSLYRQGVEYLAFWDSAKSWSIADKCRQSGTGEALLSIRRLGHLDELLAWVEAGEPTLKVPVTRLRKLGECEMTFVAE